MCARAYKTYTDTWPHINSVNAPYSTHWGQINSSTWIMFGKQMPYLIYCFAVWHSWVQGVSWNLPLASNPFSIFSPLTLLIYLLSHLLATLPSHFSVSFLPSPPSLFSSFVHAAWVSQMEWLAAMVVMQNTVQMSAGLPQWKWHKRHAHKNTFYSFMVWKSSSGGRKVHLGFHYYETGRFLFCAWLEWMNCWTIESKNIHRRFRKKIHIGGCLSST